MATRGEAHAGIGRVLQAALALVAISLAVEAPAAATPEEAAALGTTLTGTGAERSGNASGTIPAHGGDRMAAPSGHRPGDMRRIDPYADEKPARVVTGSSADEAAAQLTAGTRELLRRHAGFRLDVYPSHRSVTYPDYLIENTRRNAIATRTTDGGLGIDNARAGVPFPIPRDGSEVMWNHRLRFLGRAVAYKYDNWLVGPSGQRTLMGTAQAIEEYPAFEPKRDATLQEREPWFKWRLEFSAPQRRAGEAMLLVDTVNPLRKARRIWSYVPGQRRVKLAEMPEDAPNGGSSGTYANDDFFVYSGTLDRFDLKLVGKREVLVPYNTYRLSYHADVDAVLQPGYINPDLLRWELHRVWVVEATLKPGQRHLYSRRVFYVDEDSWIALASDEYDLNGKLRRGVFAFLSFSYDAGAPYASNHAAYDFETGAYFIAYFPGPHYGVRYIEPLPSSQWSPEALAGAGVR